MNEKKEHPSPDELQAYLDGELDQAAEQGFSDHLSSCSSCQEELARLESIIQRLEALPEFISEMDFSNEVLARIQETRRVSRGLTWTLVAEGIAAGAVLGFLIPAIRTAAWLPSLIVTRLEVQTGIRVFLTQMASNWVLWWAKLQFSLSHLLRSLVLPKSFTGILPPVWILILVVAGGGLLVNFILLSSNPSVQNNEH